MTPSELKTRREALNLSQEELAALLLARQPHLSRWESGRVPITRQRAAWLDAELTRLEAEQAAWLDADLTRPEAEQAARERAALSRPAD